MRRYYIEFDFPCSDKGMSISQMISIIHWFNSRENENFGFDLPKSNDECVGESFRIFSTDKNALKKLCRSPRLQELCSQGMVRSSLCINEVPEDAEEVIVVRNIPAEKRMPSYWMRCGYSYQEAEEKIEQLEKVRDVVYQIKLHSFSNQRPMMRCLSRVTAHQRVDGEFSSYGYSRVSQPVTVPHF